MKTDFVPKGLEIERVTSQTNPVSDGFGCHPDQFGLIWQLLPSV